MLLQKLHDYYDKNKELAKRYSAFLPQTKKSPGRDYENALINIIDKFEEQTILDVGGGNKCILSSQKKGDSKIICLDISLNQLLLNVDVDYRLMGDALNIPLSDGSIDLIISRSFIEHISSTETFIKECYRLLKGKGYLIYLFPSKFALFSIINQIIPHKIAQKILYHIRPSYKDELGYYAYYNKCYYTGIKKLLNGNGYQVVDIKHYHYSTYLDFFFPFFLLSAVYEIFTQSIKNLSSYLLVIAQKS